MTRVVLHRLSDIALIVLALVALACVASGYFQPPQTDEGTAAHLFQIAIVLLVPAGVAFLATADWSQPVKVSRSLVIPAAITTIAFAALYWLEHRPPA
jgi:hypothetical protein